MSYMQRDGNTFSKEMEKHSHLDTLPSALLFNLFSFSLLSSLLPLSSLLGPIGEAAGSLVSTDATALAEEAGSARALNVVMLGMLAASDLLPFPGDRVLDLILEAALPAFAQVNRDAFRLGKEAMKEVEAR